jgi:hypothetical protein
MNRKNNAFYALAVFLAALIVVVFRAISPQTNSPESPEKGNATINTQVLYVDTSNTLVANYEYSTRYYTPNSLGFDTNGKHIVYNKVRDSVVSSQVTMIDLVTGSEQILPVNNCRFPTINDDSTLVACVSMGNIQLITLADMSVEPYFDADMDLPQGAPQFMGKYLVFLSQRDEEAVYVIADTPTRGVVAIVPNDNNIVFSPNAEYYVNKTGDELIVRYHEGKKLTSIPVTTDLDVTRTVVGWDETSTRIFVNVSYSDSNHVLLSFDINSGEVVNIQSELSAFVSASTYNNQVLYVTSANYISVIDLQSGDTQYIGYGTNPNWLK